MKPSFVTVSNRVISERDGCSLPDSAPPCWRAEAHRSPSSATWMRRYQPRSPEPSPVAMRPISPKPSWRRRLPRLAAWATLLPSPPPPARDQTW